MIRFDFERIKAGIGCLGVALFGWSGLFSLMMSFGQGQAVPLGDELGTGSGCLPLFCSDF